jgi:hypothetical protein
MKAAVLLFTWKSENFKREGREEERKVREES